ncbi:MAG: ribbon-helix-helix protein, CopG family [Neorhizobium sp.]|nr:ribbon-helix-helix protein, CopG family [Neorhizobium sp.]
MGQRRLDITLPDEMIAAIEGRIEAGEFSSADELMRTAIDALLREDLDVDAQLSDIRQRIKQSVEDPRPSVSSADVRKHLDALFDRHRD